VNLPYSSTVDARVAVACGVLIVLVMLICAAAVWRYCADEPGNDDKSIGPHH
jgi:hypothetical protein